MGIFACKSPGAVINAMDAGNKTLVIAVDNSEVHRVTSNASGQYDSKESFQHPSASILDSRYLRHLFNTLLMMQECLKAIKFAKEHFSRGSFLWHRVL